MNKVKANLLSVTVEISMQKASLKVNLTEETRSRPPRKDKTETLYIFDSCREQQENAGLLFRVFQTI